METANIERMSKALPNETRLLILEAIARNEGRQRIGSCRCFLSSRHGQSRGPRSSNRSRVEGKQESAKAKMSHALRFSNA
jgi:hypothetical protein